MKTRILEVEDLRVEYATRQGRLMAVDGVSLDVYADEYVGIVGESGCGKTTLVKAILGILPENARIAGGSIRYKGIDLLRLPRRELRSFLWKEIALISQSAMNALDPVYRVGEQIIEAIVIHSDVPVREARTKAADLFRLVGLDPARLDDYPHQLSGGMRQRTMVAMALALNPDLIVADEPTTGLDVIVQSQILDRIAELRSGLHKAMIMVTHDIAVVAETCHRVAVMYAGKMHEAGPTQEVFERPFGPYTMGLHSAYPSLRGSNSHLIAIPGAPPNLAEVPAGCRFYERCPFATVQCSSEEPELIAVQADHYAACHYVERADEFRRQARQPATWEAKGTIRETSGVHR